MQQFIESVSKNFLKFIFQFKIFDQNCETIDHGKISIIDLGVRNYDIGPDFLEAKVKIGELIFFGSVIIELKTSCLKKSWFSENTSLSGVILFVVWEHDIVFDSVCIPVLELKKIISENLINKYKYLNNSNSDISCKQLLETQELNLLALNNWKLRLAISRLENKVNVVKGYLAKNKNNWDQTFFISLMRNFGRIGNEEFFETIAIKTDVKLFLKNKNNHKFILSILFGQSGLLDSAVLDDFVKELKNDYNFLCVKYLLKAGDYKFRYGKIRPQNFPAIRLAQMAALVYNSNHLFSKFLDIDEIKDVLDCFCFDVHEYFHNHYVLGKKSAIKSEKKLGFNFVHVLIINTIIPMVFLYGEVNKDQKQKDKAMLWLEQLPAEKNTITKKWNSFKMDITNAIDSQALTELYKNYCFKKQCLDCYIGLQILKNFN